MVLLDAKRVHGAGNIDKTMLEKCKMHPWVLRSVAKTMCNLPKETPELALPYRHLSGPAASVEIQDSTQVSAETSPCQDLQAHFLIHVHPFDVSNAKRIGMVLEHQCSIDLRPSNHMSSRHIKGYQEISNQNIKTLTGTG